MLTGFDHSELLAENYAVGSMQPPASILQELTHLALSQDELPFLAADMFELLLKKSGQPDAVKYLGGIQYLVAEGTPAGARLLAAFLNVSTPGERLIPVIQPLNSSRRYYASMRTNDTQLGPIQADWCQRMAKYKPQIQSDFVSLGLHRTAWLMEILAMLTRGPSCARSWAICSDERVLKLFGRPTANPRC